MHAPIELGQMGYKPIPSQEAPPSNKPTIIQFPFLEWMKKNGYSTNKNGMCYGVAHAAIEYIRRYSIAQFLDFLQAHPKSSLLSLKDDTQRTMLALFDAICLYQARSAQEITRTKPCKTNFHPFYKRRQQTPEIANRLLNSEQKGVFIKEMTLCPIQSNQDLKNLLESKQANKKEFFAVLETSRHAIAVIFKNGQWLLVSHNHICSTPKLTMPFILKIFLLLCKRQTCFAISMTEYVEQPPPDVKSTFLLPDKSEPFEKTEYIFLALTHGYDEAITAALKKLQTLEIESPELVEILFAESLSGTPGLCLALSLGRTGAVEAFLREITPFVTTGKISSSNLAELLSAKDPRDTPGLCVAFALGYTETVEAFLKGITPFVTAGKISSQNLVAILLAPDYYYRSGLFYALENDRFATIHAFSKELAVFVSTGKMSITQLISIISFVHVDRYIAERMAAFKEQLAVCLADALNNTMPTWFDEVKKIYRALFNGTNNPFRNSRIDIEKILPQDFLLHVSQDENTRSTKALELYFQYYKDKNLFGLAYSIYRAATFGRKPDVQSLLNDAKENPGSRAAIICTTLGLTKIRI